MSIPVDVMEKMDGDGPEEIPAPVLQPTPAWILEERAKPFSLWTAPVVRTYPLVQLEEPEPRATMAPHVGDPWPTSFIREEER
jgi:hypothetical protein